MLKNIKSLFVVEEEVTPKVSAKTSEAPKAPKPRPQAVPTSVHTGKANSKFMNVLFAAMEKANLEGFDYLEYKKSLQSLAKMPMDEATRYKSAFVMAQTMGVTPAALVNTAEHYMKALLREEQQFEQALTAQKDKQVGNKVRQNKQLQNLIQEKAAQIKKLTQEIEAHQGQQSELQQQIEGASIKIEQTKQDFIASYQQLIAQIKGDVDKMKQYLK